MQRENRFLTTKHVGEYSTHLVSDPSSNKEVTRKHSTFGEWQGITRRYTSSTLWRFSAILGDVCLLIALLELILLLAPGFQLRLHALWFRADVWHPEFMLGCLGLVSWSAAARITQAQTFNTLTNRLLSPLSILLALVLMAGFVVIVTYPLILNEVAYVKGLLWYLALAIPVFVGWRLLLASVLNLPRFRPRAVIIGANATGERIAQELLQAKRYTATVLGYVQADTEEQNISGLPMLGDRSALRHLVQQDMVDMLVMAIDYTSHPTLFHEVMELAQTGIVVIPAATLYERTGGKIPVEHIGDQWYVSLPAERMLSPLYLCWRTLLDLLMGVVGTISLLLLIPILAPFIYLSSPGPLLYKQERVGRNGRIFTMYKFRSMHPEAEEDGQAQWAASDDARVTPIGRFLRATHLDELPQVLNILRGEMSLIGPRPEREEFVEKLEKTLPFYRCRLRVKPGLTGWAQVKYGYGRNHQDALEKLQYDLYYIKHQSFMLDICIMLKTVAEVFLLRGN